MLLLTKKRWQDKLLSGEKTLEIRAGRRYRGLQRGGTVSINGRAKLRIKELVRFDSSESLLQWLADKLAQAGFASETEARAAIFDCGLAREIVVIHVERI